MPDPEPTTVRRPTRAPEAAPDTLADAILATLTARDATHVSMRPRDAGDHTIELRRGDALTVALTIDDDRAAAIAVRFATAAGLDPLVAVGSAEATANVARLKVSDGSHLAELLASMAATSRGFHLDLRVLSVDGREPTVVRSHSLRRCARCSAWASAHELTCRRDGGRLDVVEDDPRPGGTIGAWLVGQPLGEGGMGVVFAAEHALLGRAGAIKLMRRSLGNSNTLVERFLTEARAASRLRHPAIVEVEDFGVLADGRPYVVMELLRGISLHERLHDGPMRPVVALRIARGIAEALGAAHAAGVVHHDLKPSNVMLLEPFSEQSPRVKLVDFGAAAIGDFAADAHAIYGTPRYMSPERARGEPGDARSDLYALGVVLHEALSGKALFDRARPTEVLLAQLGESPPPLDLDGGVPPALAHVVTRALEKSAGERYQTASEMIADLDRAIAAYGRSNWRRLLP